MLKTKAVKKIMLNSFGLFYQLQHMAYLLLCKEILGAFDSFDFLTHLVNFGLESMRKNKIGQVKLEQMQQRKQNPQGECKQLPIRYRFVCACACMCVCVCTTTYMQECQDYKMYTYIYYICIYMYIFLSIYIQLLLCINILLNVLIFYVISLYIDCL